jgi:hypothetical protein
MLGGRTTRPASDTEEVPGLRELAVEGLIGAVALYFLVRTAPDGMGGFWWVRGPVRGRPSVVPARRAWTRRREALPAADAPESRGSTGNRAEPDGE